MVASPSLLVSKQRPLIRDTSEGRPSITDLILITWPHQRRDGLCCMTSLGPTVCSKSAHATSAACSAVNRARSGTYRHSSSISAESLQKSDSHGRSQSEIGSAAVHIDTAARSAPSRCRRQTATAAVSPRSAVQHVLSATPSNRVRPRHTEPDRPAERAPNNSANGQWPELAQH